MVDAAVAEASAMSVPVTVVLVDESGVTKEMLRMDGAPLVSVQTAINKAYAAAAIGMPPDDFYAAIESDGAWSLRSSSCARSPPSKCCSAESPSDERGDAGECDHWSGGRGSRTGRASRRAPGPM
jgi:Haem degrading protein HbpS-like